jgi:hypothetical protein
MPHILLWLLILAPEGLDEESMSDDDIVSLDDVLDRGCEDLQIVDMEGLLYQRYMSCKR